VNIDVEHLHFNATASYRAPQIRQISTVPCIVIRSLFIRRKRKPVNNCGAKRLFASDIVFAAEHATVFTNQKRLNPDRGPLDVVSALCCDHTAGELSVHNTDPSAPGEIGSA
jgi:hypothetical protein